MAELEHLTFAINMLEKDMPLNINTFAIIIEIKRIF